MNIQGKLSKLLCPGSRKRALRAMPVSVHDPLEMQVRLRTMKLQATIHELQKDYEQLDAFNYMVAHDLRAGLTNLDGLVGLLIKDMGAPLTGAAQQDIEFLQSGISHLQCMVVELLNLSRSTDAELARTALDISTMAHEVLAELHKVDPSRQVDIDIEAGLVVDADPVLMREVLQNLLGNAWKFTARRQRARIQLGASCEQSHLVLFVRDNGIGFDAVQQQNLFKPFYRASAEQGFTGTGLGLATVKRIIERHGGRIWAQGTPDQGAKFSFTLFAATDSLSLQRQA